MGGKRRWWWRDLLLRPYSIRISKLTFETSIEELDQQIQSFVVKKLVSARRWCSGGGRQRRKERGRWCRESVVIKGGRGGERKEEGSGGVVGLLGFNGHRINCNRASDSLGPKAKLDAQDGHS